MGTVPGRAAAQVTGGLRRVVFEADALLIGIGIIIGYFLFIGKKGFYVGTIFKNILIFGVMILISFAFAKLTTRKK